MISDLVSLNDKSIYQTLIVPGLKISAGLSENIPEEPTKSHMDVNSFADNNNSF